MALTTVPEGTVLGDATYPHRLYHGGNSQVLFVDSGGDDANDGLTPGTAFETVLAAYDALPAAGGEIHLMSDTVSIGDTGLYIAGTNDPDFASLSSPWRQMKNIHLIGHGNGAATVYGRQTILDPSAGTETDPTLWISGTNGSLRFTNIAILYERTPAVRLSVASNDLGNRNVNTSGLWFQGCQFIPKLGVASSGPGMDVGYIFWFGVRDSLVSAGDSGSVGDDSQYAIVMDPDGGASAGGFIFNNRFNGGGVRWKNGSTSWGMVVRECIVEGNFVDPTSSCVHMSGVNTYGNAFIESCTVADAGAGSENCVWIEPADGFNDPSIVTAINNDSVLGPATVLSHSTATSSMVFEMDNIASSGQVMIGNRRLYGVSSEGRGVHGPVAVRFVNRADTNASNWSGYGGTATVTTGQSDPAGGTSAAKLSGASSLYRVVGGYAFTVAVGDWVFGGIWAKAEDGDLPSNDQALLVGFNHTNNLLDFEGTSNMRARVPLGFAGGGWEWLWVAGKVTSVGTPSTAIDMSLWCNSGASMTYFGPLMQVVPTGTVTDNDAHQHALRLASFPNTTPVNSVTTQRGQKLITWAGLGVGNSAAATTPGSVVRKMEVFSETGTSLGFVPIYSSIA